MHAGGGGVPLVAAQFGQAPLGAPQRLGVVVGPGLLQAALQLAPRLVQFPQGQVALGGFQMVDGAGVGRRTVYRWWPTRVALVEEALTLHTAQLVVPDTGSWHSDVQALTRELAEFFADPVEVAMNAILASDVDSEVADIQRAHWGPIIRDLAGVVDRGKSRGEVRPEVSPGLVLQMIVGPLLLVASARETSTQTIVDAARRAARTIRASLGPLA